MSFASNNPEGCIEWIKICLHFMLRLTKNFLHHPLSFSPGILGLSLLYSFQILESGSSVWFARTPCQPLFCDPIEIFRSNLSLRQVKWALVAIFNACRNLQEEVRFSREVKKNTSNEFLAVESKRFCAKYHLSAFSEFLELQTHRSWRKFLAFANRKRQLRFISSLQRRIRLKFHRSELFVIMRPVRYAQPSVHKTTFLDIPYLHFTSVYLLNVSDNKMAMKKFN